METAMVQRQGLRMYQVSFTINDGDGDQRLTWYRFAPDGYEAMMQARAALKREFGSYDSLVVTTLTEEEKQLVTSGRG